MEDVKGEGKIKYRARFKRFLKLPRAQHQASNNLSEGKSTTLNTVAISPAPSEEQAGLGSVYTSILTASSSPISTPTSLALTPTIDNQPDRSPSGNSPKQESLLQLGLWERAASDLDLEEQEKLRILKITQKVSSGRDHDSLTDKVRLVLGEAEKLKDKGREAKWQLILDKIIRGALAFNAVADAAVEFDQSGYAALGWSVVSFGLKMAGNANDAYEFVLNSSEVITNFMARYRHYESKFRGQETAEEFDHHLINVYKAILLYVLALHEYLGQGRLGRFGHAFYGLDKRSIVQRKKAIHDADAEVKDWIQIIMHTRYGDNLAHLRQTLDRLNQPKPSKSSRECAKSLAFPEMDDRSNDIDRAAERTCKWLLRHETFGEWAACERGLLWIKGKPGSGKSTLLRYALDDAMITPQIGEKPLILSFFFHGRGVDLQKTPLGLFRSLLHQILRCIPEALDEVVATFEDRCANMGDPGEDWDWNPRELEKHLERSLQQILKSRPVWLFIDALDECGEDHANSLIETFDLWLQDSSPTAQFRICFTCRHYPILSLDNSETFEICVERENEQDILTYLQSQFSRRTHSSLPLTIQKEITARAQGVFLWTRFAVKHAFDLERRGVGWKKIEKAIGEIPPQLDELYHALVRGMDEKAESFKMIQWICFSLKPLTLDELRYAMVVDPSTPQQSLKQYEAAEDYVSDSAAMERRLKTLSCGLAEAIPVAHGPSVVQFIHQSVKDFFVEKGFPMLYDNPTVATDFEGMAHRNLARACIRYMATEEIFESRYELGPKPYGQPNPIVWFPEYPLLKYAATSWIGHVQKSEERGISQTDLLDYFNWPSETLVHVWTLILFKMGLSSNTRGRGPTIRTSLLHIASQNRLLGLLRLILQRVRRYVVNTTDLSKRTPLFCAVEEDHEDVIDLLLEKGSDVNIHDIEDVSALQKAASGGNEKIVRRLLEYGADVNAHGGRTWDSAVQEASCKGHENVLRVLIENRADLDIPSSSDSRETALQSAVHEGHEGIVRLLIKNGANVNAHNGADTGTTLQYAIHKGYEGIARMLLDNGANANDPTGKYGNNLIQAACYGYEAIVRLLVEKGADVNLILEQGKPFTFALEAASYKGHEQIVHFLVQNGADVHTQGPYGSALDAASVMGHEKIVRLLIDSGVDVNAQGPRGAALHAVSCRRHPNVVRALIEKGADVNLGGPDGTALQIASKEGDGLIVQWLIDNGADIDAQGPHGTALQLAALRGHEGIVGKLLENGAEVHVQGPGGSAVQIAYQTSNNRIALMILRKGTIVSHTQARRYDNDLYRNAKEGINLPEVVGWGGSGSCV